MDTLRPSSEHRPSRNSLFLLKVFSESCYGDMEYEGLNLSARAVLCCAHAYFTRLPRGLGMHF